MTTVTAQMFEFHVGHPPEQDDLERANCSKVGLYGHHQCGWCDISRLPRWMCHDCMAHRRPKDMAAEDKPS